MMTAYGLVQGRVERVTPGSAADVMWVDLLNPSQAEEKAVEALLGLAVPTRQEMAEIEDSARLYQEGGALVVTAIVITDVAEGRPDKDGKRISPTLQHMTKKWLEVIERLNGEAGTLGWQP